MSLRFIVSFVAMFAVSLSASANDRSIENMRRDLTFLASDECEGRGVRTQGIHKAATHIVKQFEQAGLKPGGPNNTWFQPFTMSAGAELQGPATLRLTGPLGQEITFQAGLHFEPAGISGSGTVTAPIVFAGHGIMANEAKYSDFEGVDVAGKIVVILRRTPMAGSRHSPFDTPRTELHAGIATKIRNAGKAKAAAVLLVNDHDTAINEDRLAPFRYLAWSESPVNIPVLHVRRVVVDAMTQAVWSKTLRQVEAEIDRDLKPKSALLAGWSAYVQTNVLRRSVEMRNIIAVLDGKGPLANETVVVGAHYDHLGRGENGSLARNPLDFDKYHYGADDNGSGTTAILELARRFAAQKDRVGRRIVFICFSGEEQGLIGSRYYCNHPVFALKDTVAMLNLDMVGRLRPDIKTKKDRIEIGGIGTAPTFEPLIDDLNKRFEFTISKVKSGFGPSDHTSFYEKKIPVFFFYTLGHPEYHTPADRVETINFAGMKKVVEMSQEVATHLATKAERPTYVHVPSSMPGGRVSVPRIEFMPGDYNEAEAKGVLIGSVTKDGPADKAGIKGGDFIVEIAGQPVKNMSGYMTVMSGKRPGEAIEMTILRGEKRIKVKVTPR